MRLDSYAGAFEDYRRMVHANALRLGIGMPVDPSREDQPPQYLPPAPPAPPVPPVPEESQVEPVLGLSGSGPISRHCWTAPHKYVQRFGRSPTCSQRPLG